MKALLFFLFPTLLHAQAPGVKIVEQSRAGMKIEEDAISQQVEKLAADHLLISVEDVRAAMKKPNPRKITLISASTTPLRPTEVAVVAGKSCYRVGWGYLCENCDHWHVNLGGAYAVTDDGILATCAHVVDNDDLKIREGGLIAVDHSGKVFPVTAILAYHEKMDAALISIDTQTTPLALNDQVSPGDQAFCLSRPLNQKDYFSQGIVNRFYWNNSQRGGDDTDLKALAYLKLNVSSRWAPGSSGSPVLDHCGNVIGHVALIHTMGNSTPSDLNGKGKAGDKTLITLHTATPARSVMALARSMP